MTSRLALSYQLRMVITCCSKGPNVANYSSIPSQSHDHINHFRKKLLEYGIVTKELSNKFFAEPIQDLLLDLTHINVQKAFRKRLTGRNPSIPIYKFMTTAEIEKLQVEIREKAKEKLKMPPIVPLKTDLGEVLNVDKDIVGYDNSKYLFTDITFGVSDKSRIIVVREPDGTLRKATADERHNANQIYFPQSGRELKHPTMFKNENLKPLLENGDYEFILDRACCQFEPDDNNYHRVVFSTYKHVNEKQKYQVLESTRHLGPLLFYLAFDKMPDNYIMYCLETDKLKDVLSFIQLYTKINNSIESELNIFQENQFEVVKDFIKSECQEKAKVETVLNNFISIYNNIESKIKIE